jgi:hypothetical protein
LALGYCVAKYGLEKIKDEGGTLNKSLQTLIFESGEKNVQSKKKNGLALMALTR